MEWFYWLIIAGGSLLVLIIGRFFFNGPSASSTRDMKGKLVIVTGSSSGIGKETAFDLLKKGAEVVFACRDERKTLEVIAEIEGIEIKSKAKFMRLDLCDFDSIVQFAENVSNTYMNRKIDILINNAGVICKEYRKTKNNIEQTLQANLIGSVILSALLIDKIENEGRIINVSSMIHHRANPDFEFLENDMNFEKNQQDYKSMLAYENSKIGQIFFTKSMVNFCRIKNLNVKNFSLHPGVVNTSLFDNIASNTCICIIYYLIYPLLWYVTKTNWMGAQTTLQLCYEDYSTLIDGGYYKNCGRSESSDISKDEKKINRFMKYCCNLIEINSRENNKLNQIPFLKYLKNPDQTISLLQAE